MLHHHCFYNGFFNYFSNSNTSLLAQLFDKLGIQNIDWRKPHNAIAMTTIYGIWRMLPFQIILFTVAFLKLTKDFIKQLQLMDCLDENNIENINSTNYASYYLYDNNRDNRFFLKFIPFGLFADYQEAVKSNAQTAVYYICSNYLLCWNNSII
nr:hypothetical protein [Entomoplasma sp. MP1]